MTDEDKLRGAIERARIVIPHLKTAARMALDDVGEGGKVELAIIATDKTNAGRVGAQFSYEDFMADLETLAGWEGEEPTDEDVATARLLGALDTGFVKL